MVTSDQLKALLKSHIAGGADRSCSLVLQLNTAMRWIFLSKQLTKLKLKCKNKLDFVSTALSIIPVPVDRLV